MPAGGPARIPEAPAGIGQVEMGARRVKQIQGREFDFEAFIRRAADYAESRKGILVTKKTWERP